MMAVKSREVPEPEHESCQKTFFEEAQEFQTTLEELCEIASSSVSISQQDERRYQRLSQILDKYQEQSHLLDRHLELILAPVVRTLRSHIDWFQSAEGLEKQGPLEPDSHPHQLFRLVYQLTKVRGYKTIGTSRLLPPYLHLLMIWIHSVVKYLTHEAADLEPLLAYLKLQDVRIFSLWETRYVLLLWLSLIVRIPFDLQRLDSHVYDGKTLVQFIVEMGQSFLKSTGKERDAAAELLARLLTRKDTVEKELGKFIQWAADEVFSQGKVILTIGALSTLSGIYKYGAREHLVRHTGAVLPLCHKLLDPQCALNSNTLARKLCIKLVQRLALAHLKPVVASWRYQRGNRSLAKNLATAPVTLASVSTQNNGQRHSLAPNVAEEDEEVAECVEEMIEVLLNGLQDKDTIVRWSASKGLGRITMRLPKELAQDVIDSVISLFSDGVFKNPDGTSNLSTVSDQTWHGTCLAVAELARRGLLLPEKLPSVLQWIYFALTFDQRKGSYSVGAHVRDAACYVCWSFARAYAPEIMEPYVQDLAVYLIVVAVYDREVNVRRAASAAFQENVGRQGIFPHGIDIVTAADYFTVGNRKVSFLETSIFVAKFNEYRQQMIRHLLENAVPHWDIEMRKVASQTLHLLSSTDSAYIMEFCLPKLIESVASAELYTRHGSVLALSEIISSLQGINLKGLANSHEDLVKKIASLPGDLYIDYPSYFASFGSDIFRDSVCQLMLNLCKSEWPISDFSKFFLIVETSLERPEMDVQLSAVAAFHAILGRTRLTESQYRNYISRAHPEHEPSARRGFCMALGKIEWKDSPSSDLWSALIEALIMASTLHENKQFNNAEARKSGIQSLGSLITKFQDQKNSQHYEALKPTGIQFQRAFDAIFDGLNDYSTDSRGDIGSWVRETSCVVMANIYTAFAEETLVAGSFLFSQLTPFISKVLLLSAEKIDRTRAIAMETLQSVLAVHGRSLPIVARNELEDLFHCSSDIYLGNPVEVFPLLVKLLHIPEYRVDLLTGFAASVGGLTESLVRYSSSTLQSFLQELPMHSSKPKQNLSLHDFLILVKEIFVRHKKVDRVIGPVLELMDLLLGSEILNSLSDDSKSVEILNDIIVLTKAEVYKTKDVKKLLSAVKVWCCFISYPNQIVQRPSLRYVLTYLVHPYPRVRRFVAEQLYVALTTSLDQPESMDTVETILLETDWDANTSDLKPVKSQLMSLLNVESSLSTETE